MEPVKTSRSSATLRKKSVLPRLEVRPITNIVESTTMTEARPSCITNTFTDQPSRTSRTRLLRCPITTDSSHLPTNVQVISEHPPLDRNIMTIPDRNRRQKVCVECDLSSIAAIVCDFCYIVVPDCRREITKDERKEKRFDEEGRMKEETEKGGGTGRKNRRGKGCGVERRKRNSSGS